MTDGYDFRTLPTDGPLDDTLSGWEAACALGFGQPAKDAAAQQRWLGYQHAAGVRLRGAYDTSPGGLLPATQPVATYGSFDQTINVGGGRLEPANLVTDVTVRTSHRRRGLLRELITRDLAEARERGLTLASLMASEGTIYGRFGFGVATRAHRVELDTGPRFRLVAPLTGRVEQVLPTDAVAVRHRVYDAFHSSTRGSHGRPGWYDDHLSGAWDFEKNAPNPDVRTAAHLDEAGTPDGVITYVFDEPNDQVKVWDLVAATPEAELGLWHFAGSIDLVPKVVFGRLSPASPLPWALADHRCVKTTGLSDFLWFRLLDVPRALQARGWDADGTATFAVHDTMGLSSGSWTVAVSDGHAEVTPAASEPAVTIALDALGSLYSGLADARVLAAAGRIDGPRDALGPLASLFRTDAEPYSITGF